MGKILITGVAGLLGSRLADWIIKNTDYKVVGIDDLRDMMGIDKADITLPNWALTKWEDLNKYFVNIPDNKLIVVKLGLSILKVSAIALLMKTALAAVGVGIVKVVAAVLIFCLLTNTEATAQVIRKLGVSLAAIGPAVIKDLAKGFRFLKDVGSKIWESGKSFFNKIFRRAAVQQIRNMMRSNPRFRQAYLAV